MFNICFKLSIVQVDWVIACMVPLYKGKGDVHECSNFRGISLSSVIGKVYGRLLIDRIRDKTENVIAEVQGGFRRGRGCTDEIISADNDIWSHSHQRPCKWGIWEAGPPDGSGIVKP